MPRYRVTLEQKFIRYATVEVEAVGALAAIDHAERLAPTSPWGKAMPSAVEVSKVENVGRQFQPTTLERQPVVPGTDAVLMYPTKGARCKLCLRNLVLLEVFGTQGCPVHGLSDAIVNGELFVLVSKSARALAWVQDNAQVEPWQVHRWLVGRQEFVRPLVDGLRRAGLVVEEKR